MEIKKGLRFGRPLVMLAGGRGFEPRLTESESAVLPLDDPPGILLTLGVLGSTACFAQADLLALDLARITGDKTGFPQGGA